MSESEQSDRMHARIQPLQNPEEQQAIELIVEDGSTAPTYANFCRVTATPEEVLLDFGLNSEPFASGQKCVKASQRVVMNFFTAKRLVAAIGITVQRHEQTFGAVEMDIRRRAGMPQPQVSQDVPLAANGTGEVIRLSR